LHHLTTIYTFRHDRNLSLQWFSDRLVHLFDHTTFFIINNRNDEVNSRIEFAQVHILYSQIKSKDDLA